MKAEAVSFLEDFVRNSVGAQYIIPVYQRNYNWKKDTQVKKLLDDVDGLLEDTNKIHFMGSLIYLVTIDGLIGQERSVVDGQQRLTTLFLMLYSLRDIAIDLNQNELASSLTSFYLENPASNDKYKLKLKPSVSDDDCFKKIATKRIDRIEDEKSNVLINYNFIKEYFRGKILNHSMEEIVDALKRLNVVYIRLDDKDDAQLIFESINSTGMDLTSADLIRNFILMNRNNDVQERIYKEYWRKVEIAFGASKKVELFFRLYIGIKQYTLCNINKVYVNFREFWNKEILIRNYEEILEEVLNYTIHYETLFTKTIEDDLKQEIADFRKINSEMPATFVMETMELFRKDILTKQQVKAVIGVVNTYMVRRYLVERQTNEISRTFPTCLKNVIEYCEHNSYSEYEDATKRYLINNNMQNTAFMPTDKEIEEHLATTNAFVMKNLRWLLERIEMKDNIAVVNFSNLSIEHIMPQTRNDAWTRADISDEEYDNFKHRIGNLTLATERDNSAMGNKFFDYKRDVLSRTSHIRMNQSIAEKQNWGFDEITNRTEEMIKDLLSIFPYVKSEKDEILNRDIYIQIKGENIALGRLNVDNSVTVYLGSKIISEIQPDSRVAKEKREELLALDIIIEEDGGFVLTENCDFTSPTLAAEFVLGGSNNGWEIWKGYNGKDINSIFVNNHDH